MIGSSPPFFPALFLAVSLFASSRLYPALHPSTEVWTRSGLHPLQQLGAGEWLLSTEAPREGSARDQALAYSCSSERLQSLRAIAQVAPSQLGPGRILSFADGSTLHCSDDQLFWTAEGWTRADQLVCGSACLSGRGEWIPLLFPPYPAHFATSRVTLLPSDLNDPPHDRLFFIGRGQLLVHNDSILVPVVTLLTKSGEIVWIGASMLLATAAQIGAEWLLSLLENRLNRFGLPATTSLGPPPLDGLAPAASSPPHNPWVYDSLRPDHRPACSEPDPGYLPAWFDRPGSGQEPFPPGHCIAYLGEQPSFPGGGAEKNYAWSFEPLLLDCRELSTSQSELLSQLCISLGPHKNAQAAADCSLQLERHAQSASE